jgi:hypothetical protein
MSIWGDEPTDALFRIAAALEDIAEQMRNRNVDSGPGSVARKLAEAERIIARGPAEQESEGDS